VGAQKTWGGGVRESPVYVNKEVASVFAAKQGSFAGEAHRITIKEKKRARPWRPTKKG